MIRSANRRLLLILWMTLFAAVGTVTVVYAASMSREWLNANARTAPDLVLPHTLRDLGTLSSRGREQVAFEVANRGGQRLVINRLGGGCRCDDAAPRTVILSPGQSGQISVTLDTRQADGPVEEVSSFSTSDPECARFELTVRAQVAADAR